MIPLNPKKRYYWEARVLVSSQGTDAESFVSPTRRWDLEIVTEAPDSKLTVGEMLQRFHWINSKHHDAVEQIRSPRMGIQNQRWSTFYSSRVDITEISTMCIGREIHRLLVFGGQPAHVVYRPSMPVRPEAIRRCTIEGWEFIDLHV